MDRIAIARAAHFGRRRARATVATARGIGHFDPDRIGANPPNPRRPILDSLGRSERQEFAREWYFEQAERKRLELMEKFIDEGPRLTSWDVFWDWLSQVEWLAISEFAERQSRVESSECRVRGAKRF